MEYIKTADYDYITNKYAKNGNRFTRVDNIFAPETGMDGDLIRSEIVRRDKEISHLPHPVRKAKAFEFVLDNTRISCDSHDVFPAINAIDRPVNGMITDTWNAEVFDEVIPDVSEKRSQLEDDGIVTI